MNEKELERLQIENLLEIIESLKKDIISLEKQLSKKSEVAEDEVALLKVCNNLLFEPIQEEEELRKAHLKITELEAKLTERDAKLKEKNKKIELQVKEITQLLRELEKLKSGIKKIGAETLIHI